MTVTWQDSFIREAGSSSKKEKRTWVDNARATASTVASRCWKTLFEFTLSMLSLHTLLNPSQTLPKEHYRRETAVRQVASMFLCYVIVREVLRHTKKQNGTADLSNISFAHQGLPGKQAPQLRIAEFWRLCSVRNPAVEAMKDVLDSSLLQTCCELQLHNVLPRLDPLLSECFAPCYAQVWGNIAAAGIEDPQQARVTLLLTMFPILKGRSESMAEFFRASGLMLTNMESGVKFLQLFHPDCSRLEAVRLVGDQRTSETRMGKQCNPKVEVLSILWDHWLDTTRTSWFSLQASTDLRNQASVDLLMMEKGFGGTGFNAKNIVNGIAACDEITGLHLFPSLQTDSDVCGPNPQKLLEIIYGNDSGGSPSQLLRRFQKLVAALCSSGIKCGNEDLSANIREAVNKTKWVQLNMCKYLQVEEVRVEGRYGIHRRAPRRLGQPSDLPGECSDDAHDGSTTINSHSRKRRVS